MTIHVEKNVFLVPYWIVNTVQRNHLNLSAILNLEKLTEITSAEDLAITSLLNENNTRVFGINAYSTALYSTWFNDTAAWAKFTSQVKPLEAIVGPDLENRLFNQAAYDSKYPNPFEIKDIETNTFLVIIYPGFFGSDDYRTHQFNLTRELLKLFYVYEGYDDMARRQIFEFYLSNL